MNKNFAIVVLFSALFAESIEAQSNLVLYDGDGERIGQFLYEYQTSLGDMVILTEDGLDLTRFGGHVIVTEVRGVHNGKATTNVYAGVPAADG